MEEEKEGPETEGAEEIVKNRQNDVTEFTNFLNSIMRMTMKQMSKMAYLHFVVPKAMKAVVDLTKIPNQAKIHLSFLMRTKKWCIKAKEIRLSKKKLLKICIRVPSYLKCKLMIKTIVYIWRYSNDPINISRCGTMRSFKS